MGLSPFCIGMLFEKAEEKKKITIRLEEKTPGNHQELILTWTFFI